MTTKHFCNICETTEGADEWQITYGDLTLDVHVRRKTTDLLHVVPPAAEHICRGCLTKAFNPANHKPRAVEPTR